MTAIQSDVSELTPRLVVFGVGGAGGNAVNNMIRANLQGVEFVAANTDSQALLMSKTPTRIQLGHRATEGLGAGARPEIGMNAAEESLPAINEYLAGAHMIFIAAGMGGGTGTGAAPVIARAARERGILTVGVVTKPFMFEGSRRMQTAELGVNELEKWVDTLIVIPNQNLFRLANDKTTFSEAFSMADHVLYSGVRGVTDLMVKPGLINLDFADVRTVMAEMGKAMMGTGEGEGPRRALDAAYGAITNPLLDDVSMKGAKGVLINITGGYDMTLYEVDEAANAIRAEVDPLANIILGSTFDEALEGKIRVSVVATGIQKITRPADAPVPGPVRDVEPERPAVWNAEPHMEDDGIRIRINNPAQAVEPEARPEPQAAPPPPAFPEDVREAERGRPSFSLFGWRRQDGGNPQKGHEPRSHEQRHQEPRNHDPRAHEPAPEPRVQTPAPPPVAAPEPETPIDDLEIPAFLRRQMK
jgi:cell division protein FtsZ